MNGQCMQVYEEVGLNISAQVSARLSLSLRPLAGDRCRPAPPPPSTKWTRRVPHPVLIGHVSCRPATPRALRQTLDAEAALCKVALL